MTPAAGVDPSGITTVPRTACAGSDTTPAAISSHPPASARRRTRGLRMFHDPTACSSRQEQRLTLGPYLPLVPSLGAFPVAAPVSTREPRADHRIRAPT